MRREVWKFPIAPGENEVVMPVGAHVISAQQQGDFNVVLWAIVDRDAPTQKRRVFVAMTGQDLPKGIGWRHFVATVQVGPIVSHIFDVAPDTL